MSILQRLGLATVPAPTVTAPENTDPWDQSKPWLDRATVHDIGRLAEFTPDAHLFNRTLYQLFFLYGADMKSHWMHDRLIKPYCMNNRPFADVFTNEHFTMVKKKLGWATYPVVTDLKLWNVPQLPIRGQLVALHSAQIKELDRVYQNTVEFNRIRIKVNMPHHRIMYSRKSGELSMIKANHFQYEAWAYIGAGEYYKDIIDAGFLFGNINITDPNKHQQLKQYYHFTHVEYQHE